MRAASVSLLVCLCAACAVPSSLAGNKKKSELKWARQVALDFLAIAVDKDRPRDEEPAAVAGLLSPHAAKGILGQGWNSPLWRLGKYTVAKITKDEVSPDHRELICSGTLSGSRWEDEEPGMQGDFKLRVAKDAASGQWGIRYLHVSERKGKAVQREPKPGNQ
jgi:hypothetical protein